jgi:DNA-binding NtrC family response regulator
MVRLLLVDDERDFLQSLAKVLERRGMEVRTAHDGETALALHAAGAFDVVVLDLRMPGIDGVDVLRELRARGDTLTQVLLLTGHADMARLTEALREGATHVLLKPCAIEELIAAIEDAAERRAAAAAAPR